MAELRDIKRSACLLVFVLAIGSGVAWATDHAEERGGYLGPCSLVAAPDGKTLYVACADSRQVAWVDLPGGKVARRVGVPSEPTGLAITSNGKKLVVTCAAPRSTVAVLDAASGSLLAAIPAGHTAMSPAISRDGKWLYVCNRFNNDVSVIDLAAGKEVTHIPVVREPIAAAVTPDDRTVLVANHQPNSRTDAAFEGDVAAVVTVIDAETHKTTAIGLPHGSNGLRDLCISPDGKHAFVTHLLSNFQAVPFRVDMGWINVNVISILNIPQRKLVRTVGMDSQDMGAANPWGILCTPDGKWVCVSIAGTHELCVIEQAALLGESARTMTPMMGVWPIYVSLGESLWRRIKLPGKGPRGLAAGGAKIYAAEYFSDALAVVDPQASPDVPAGALALGPVPRWTQSRRGELLFHDATICYQQWQSCASCHPDGRADSLNWDLMNDGVGNPKNTKSLLVAHRTPPAMAEGGRISAEDAVRSGLRSILFTDRPEDEAAAIDAYLKSLRPAPSPRLVDGRLSPAAERGRALFQSDRVGCGHCHPAPLYTDLKPHNVGSRSPNERSDRFDTPSLVEVWRTAPYLHDDRYTSVKDLLIEGEHGLRHVRGRDPTEREIDDLIEFVLSL